MQTTTNEVKRGNRTQQAHQQQNITFPTPDLLISLAAVTEQELFGNAAIHSRRKMGPAVTIPGGDVQTHYAARVPAFGVMVEVPQENQFEETIAKIAKQLALAAGTIDGLNTAQVQRIAIEYTVQAAALAPTQVEPWEAYLPRARDLRQAYKTLNAVGKFSAEEAFVKNDATKAVQVSTDAAKAWGKIQTLCAQSPHLATFRAELDLPPIYTETAGWIQLKGMKTEQRQAVLQQIAIMIEESENANPFVNEQRVQEAVDRVAALQRLTYGNAFGVQPEAHIRAVSKERHAGKTQPNGGKTARVEGVPSSILGGILGGMNGQVSADFALQANGEIQITATVREGGLGAFSVPTFGTKHHAQA